MSFIKKIGGVLLALSLSVSVWGQGQAEIASRDTVIQLSDTIIDPLDTMAMSDHARAVLQRNRQEGFNDTIDRLDPDFVLVSLYVADPTDQSQDYLGITGHAFLRLQCPTFGLDFCFSYESEKIKGQLWDFITGKLKMGMVVVPTNEYIEDYRNWKRAVHEYRLNLPPEAEQRLWEQMDGHMLAEQEMQMNLFKFGCANTVLRYVERALEPIVITYDWPQKYYTMSAMEITEEHLDCYPWTLLGVRIVARNDFAKRTAPKQKVIFPTDLLEVWSRATINGEPMLTYMGDLVEGAPLDVSKPWFTPMIAAILIMLITIGMAFTRYPYWDWILLGGQAIYGCVLIFLWIIMSEFGGAAYIMMVLFNPLPLILWKWRRYWTMPYAILLVIGVVVLLFMPHMLVDPAFLVLALAYVVLFAKDSVKQFIASRR